MKPYRSALLILPLIAAGTQPSWGLDVTSRTLGPTATYWVATVAVDPRNPDVLFAGSDDLYLSRDGGASWQVVMSPEAVVGGIEIDAGNPDIVYAAAGDAIFRSMDGGRTWHAPGQSFSGWYVNTLKAHPRVPGLIYAEAGGYFRSSDHGETWHPILEGAGILEALAVDPRDPGILYAGGLTSMVRSPDGGDSWTAIDSGIPFDEHLRVSSLAVDPHQSGVLIAGVTYFTDNGDGTHTASGRIYKSMDDGGSWRMTSQVGGWPAGILIDPVDPGIVLLGSVGKTNVLGTYLSVDGGFNWEQIHDSGARKIVPSPGEAGTYLAAMAGDTQHVVRLEIGDATAVRNTGWGSLKALVAPRSPSR